MAATEMAFGTIPVPCVEDCRHGDCIRARTAAATICPVCSRVIGFHAPFCAEYAEAAELRGFSLYPYADVYGRAFRLIHAGCATVR